MTQKIIGRIIYEKEWLVITKATLIYGARKLSEDDMI